MSTVQTADVRCHLLQYESPQSYTSARNWWHKKRNFTLVEIETNAGLRDTEYCGLGSAAMSASSSGVAS